ncbi:PP2C family protein-serine/threonine phosphatase [Spongisporangium articulatum]|uniref:PP2C family protein-serine/threonine phosphatase n=1 Tax=Spongisporangium articulatum TaxID=3362603 RepID=A0ABW8AI60_9ACTN
MAVALRYAALSDVGLVRSNNQDSGYAGPRLLVIADGMGGHAGGDIASSLAIGEMAHLDGESYGPDAVLSALSQSVHAAHGELLARVAEEPALTGMGTTVTALLRTGGRLALAHIGDSRAYLLRDGELTQITRDHTFVQRLVDDGRITPEEAETHPQRSVLMRVLSDVVEDVEPDLSVREAKVGDRYLLCSDGLSSVVSHETIEETMSAGDDPAATCQALVQLALRGGAPDNVTCIVADIVDTATTPTDTVPTVVGSAALREPPRARPAATTPAERAAELTGVLPAVPPAQPDSGLRAAPPAPEPPRSRLRRLRLWLGVSAVVLILVAGGFGAYRWSQGQFFVGDAAGVVAIYKGLPDDLGPIKLSSVVVRDPTLPVAIVPQSWAEQLDDGIPADSRADAERIVQAIRVETCTGDDGTSITTPTATAEPTGSPGASSSASSTASTEPSPDPSASASPGAQDPSTLPACEGFN